MDKRILNIVWLRVKNSDRLLVLTVALFVSIILSLFLYNIPVLGRLLQAAFVAIFGATLVEIIFFIRSFVRFRALQSFFGSYFGEKSVMLVYPEFELCDEIKLYCKQKEIPLAKMYQHIHSDPDFPCNIFVPKTVANNDMEALLVVHGFLVRQGLRPSLKPVSALEAVNCSVECLISFGFTSNRYSVSCVAGCKFVKVVPSEDKTYFEFIEVTNMTSEFKNIKYRFCSSDSYQIGIVCRYSLRPNDNPNERWFMCGGIGPFGTIAAASYLTENWKFINETIGCKDFVAIVEIVTRPTVVIAPSLLMIATENSQYINRNPSALKKYTVLEV